MANLQPEQREHLSSEIAQAMRDASPEDREAFKEGSKALPELPTLKKQGIDLAASNEMDT